MLSIKLFYSKTAEYTFFPPNAHGTFSRIDHILSPKSNLVKFRKIKIVLCSLDGLMKLKLQCFGLLMQRANSFEKPLMLGKTEGRRRRG